MAREDQYFTSSLRRRGQPPAQRQRAPAAARLAQRPGAAHRRPLAGTVKQVLVNTVGGVVRPGQDLIEIVPAEDALLVEARIKPSDIAFLRPGLPAKVKITAYDYTVYGVLPAELDHISADSILDEKTGESQYLVRVRTTENRLHDAAGQPLPIIPGMTASVDVLTGKHSVLDYLLKPILKVFSGALHER